MEQILIENGAVILRTVQEIKRISTDDFYRLLANDVGFRTPILPANVIYHASKKECRLYATCLEPCEKALKVRTGGGVVTYKVKLPYVYLFHKYVNNAFDNLYVFCANSRIRHGTDMLFRLPLKNLYSDSRVCLGSGLRFDLTGTLAEKIARTEAYFWHSDFNSDLDSVYFENSPDIFRVPEREPLAEWRELSQDESFDPLEIRWRSHREWDAAITAMLEGR